MGRSSTKAAGVAAAGSRKSAPRRDSTQSTIRDVAISMFSEFGYHAVTLRKLADRVGIQAGSLYNHIENKQELLFELLHEIMSELVGGFEESVEGVDDPRVRLEAFVRNHVVFHTTRKQEVFIGNMELRNLEPENRAKLVALRDRYQNHLSEIFKDGRDSGAFQIEDVRMLTFAILGMLTAIATWFNPGGRKSADEVSEYYVALIFGILGAKQVKARRAR